MARTGASCCRAAGLACTADFDRADPVLRFIGLFDTVVAVNGGRADEQPRVALRPGVARQVLQLCARDEHRQHYPLTSVAPPFAEIALPGVHANIGGGYNQLDEGPKLLSRPRRRDAAPRGRGRLPDATAGGPAGDHRLRRGTGRRRALAAAAGRGRKGSVGGCLAPVAAAAARLQPQRAAVTGAVRDGRRGTAAAHRLALPADRAPGDAAACHRCRR